MLAETHSISASIITVLNLTRTIVKETLGALRDNREDQQNLLGILGATRYKTFHQGGMYHTVCPKMGCYQRDTFWHTIECHGLREIVCPGPGAVPFLIEVARVTRRPKDKAVIPYPEIITEETKRRDVEAILNRALRIAAESSEHRENEPIAP